MAIRFLAGLFIILLACSLSAQDEKTEKTMENWVYPYTVQKATLNDSLEIAYIDEGEGPVLLFVHGLGSNLQAWKKNIDSLRTTHRCIAVDLPGYGKSTYGEYPYGMHFFATSLLQFIDILKLDDVTLVGHSMGGQIAVHSVLSDTASISRLVLLAPAGFEKFTAEEQQWFMRFVTPQAVQATPDAQIVRNFEMNFHEMPDDARFMVEDRMLLKASPAYEQYSEMIPLCVKGMLEESIFADLPAIKIPTLVIYGENDALIPNPFLHPGLSVAEVARNGVAEIPNAQLRLLPAAGHFVQWEQASTVNQLINAFVNEESGE